MASRAIQESRSPRRVRPALPDKRRRHSEQAVLPLLQVVERREDVAAAVEAGEPPQQRLTARMGLGILRTTPQPQRSVLAEPAADELW